MKVRNDLEIYDRHGTEWWDLASPRFRSLHGVNRLRLSLLDDWVGTEIAGRRIIDIGCGGGLLSEPLALRGGAVVGLDRSEPSLRAARAHARESRWTADLLPPAYVHGDALHVPFPDGSFDAVLLADILEHLDDPAAAIAEAARVLRPGGWLYTSTIDRTLRAKLLVVHLAEGVGLIPKGTHDPRMFVRPAELDAAARSAGLNRIARVGESPALAATLRARAIRLRPTRSTAVAYSALFRKEEV